MTPTYLFCNTKCTHKASLIILATFYQLIWRITSVGQSTCPATFLLSPDKRISAISTPANKGDIPRYTIFFIIMPQWVNIMVFTEDLWFLSGVTTVLLQKT